MEKGFWELGFQVVLANLVTTNALGNYLILEGSLYL